MYTWNVYYENADTDEPARLIGTIQADTMSDAIELASQYYEHASYDIVVRRIKETDWVETVSDGKDNKRL